MEVLFGVYGIWYMVYGIWGRQGLNDVDEI